MIGKGFIKSTIVYSIVGSLPLASGFILLPFFAGKLETAVYGQFALYTAFTMLMQIVINLSLDYGLQITYFENKGQLPGLEKRIGTIISSMLIIGSFFIISFTLFGPFLFNLYNRVFPSSGLEFYPYGFYSLITAFLNSYSKSYNNLLISQQKPIKFFWINILNFSLTLVLTIVLLQRYPNTLIGPISARMISAGVVFLISFYLILKEFKLAFDWNFFKSITLVCLPLVINALLNWSLGYSDRFIITKYLTIRETGIFDFALKTTFLIDIILTGLYNTVFPKVFRYLIDKDQHHSDQYYNTYFNSMTGLNILLISSTILLIQLILPFLHVKPDYYLSLNFIGLIGISFIFKTQILYCITPIYAFKKTKSLPRIYGIAAIIQIILSIFLIKYFGISGACISMIINKPIQIVLIRLETRKFFKFTYNRTKILFLPVVYFLFVMGGEFLAKEISRTIIYSVEFIISGLLVLLVFRNELRSLFMTYWKEIRS